MAAPYTVKEKRQVLKDTLAMLRQLIEEELPKAVFLFSDCDLLRVEISCTEDDKSHYNTNGSSRKALVAEQGNKCDRFVTIAVVARYKDGRVEKYGHFNDGKEILMRHCGNLAMISITDEDGDQIVSYKLYPSE